MRLTIAKRRSLAAGESVTGPAGVRILAPAPDEAVRGPVRVQFHASGHNIGHADAQVPGTSHFRLVLARTGKPPEVLDLRGGQTEVWLNPPRGDYRLQLELVGNRDGEPVTATAPVQRMLVGGPPP